MLIPYYKYIINQVFYSNKIQNICDDLNKRHFSISYEEVSEIYNDLVNTLPEIVRESVMKREPLSLDIKAHEDILKYYGIYDLYTYTVFKNNRPPEAPYFFKWLDDLDWVMRYEDVMTLVNVLMFNGEPLEGISSVVLFKYKKKVGYDALVMYKELFWDIDVMSAKEAIKYCNMLKNSSYVIRRFVDGEVEVEHAEFKSPEDYNGTSQAFYMMDTNYIKWKIGYKSDVKIPDVKDFLNEVKMDSIYKYQEALNMTRVVDVDTEEGEGFQGPISITKVKKRNVESERVRLMKSYLDLFIKAEEKMPDDSKEEESFFKNIQQLNMTFVNNEKILNVDDDPQILLDVKDDM